MDVFQNSTSRPDCSKLVKYANGAGDVDSYWKIKLTGGYWLEFLFTGKDSFTLYFGVKFYAADPCKLVEEITRFVSSDIFICLFMISILKEGTSLLPLFRYRFLHLLVILLLRTWKLFHFRSSTVTRLYVRVLKLVCKFVVWWQKVAYF